MFDEFLQHDRRTSRATYHITVSPKPANVSTSIPPQQADRKEPHRRAPSGPTSRRRRLRIWVVLIGTVVISVVLFGIIRSQGYVRGEEFSPSHFQQRTFSFYEIPLLHLQITPIRRDGSTTETGRFLRQNGLIQRSSGNPTKWHPIWLQRGPMRKADHDARLLVEQLGIEAGGDAYWREWSQDHPKHAQRLWPIIQRLAKQELYLFVPGLLEIAQLDQTPEQLATAIDRYLVYEYQLLIEDLRAAGRTEIADGILREAKSAYPGDPMLSRMTPSKAE